MNIYKTYLSSHGWMGEREVGLWNEGENNNNINKKGHGQT